jgi:cholesterol transport system auxiliary component
MSAFRTFAVTLAAVAVAACGALPDKPARQTLYDFGPAPALEAAAPASAAPLVLEDVQAAGALETTALLYRLGYADAHQLHPYAFARWSAPPAQLVRQRLGSVLGRDRAVLDPAAAAALGRRSGAGALRVLRVELEEFSHYFESTTASRGELRVRCTLLESTAGGERLLAQRSFAVQRPAASADPAGGVRALTAATDAAAQDIVAWVRQN